MTEAQIIANEYLTTHRHSKQSRQTLLRQTGREGMRWVFVFSMVRLLLNRLTFLFLFLQLMVIKVNSQSQQWQLASGTEGNAIAAIDIYHNNPDTLYAIGSKGIIISTDNGKSWERISGISTDFGALKIDPFNSNIVYVSHFGVSSGGNDVSMTTDGGITWRRLFIGRFWMAPVIEIDPNDLKTVYVAQGPGTLHRSTDQFQTWESIRPPTNSLTSLAIDPTNDSILYVGSTRGIYKSTDRGNSWTELWLGFSLNNWTQVAVDPSNNNIVYVTVLTGGTLPGGVFKSTDQGVTWTEINDGLEIYDREIEKISINKKYPQEIIIGLGNVSNHLCFISKNSGIKWNAYYNGLPDSGHVGSILIDFFNDVTYLGIGSWGSSGLYYIDRSGNDIKDQNTYFQTYSLSQNYPNPFNLETKIEYVLPKNEYVTIKVFDLLGNEVTTLVDENKQAGEYYLTWRTGNLSSGVYYYKLSTKTKSIIKRMILLK